MGIGESKPNAAESTTKLAGQRRPLFRLRRRRRIIKTLSTISTQELLVTDTGSLKDYASSPSHSLVDPLDRRPPAPVAVAPVETAQACSQEEIRDEVPASKREGMEEEPCAINRKGDEGDHGQMISKGEPIREWCGDEMEMLSPDHKVDCHEKEEGGAEKEKVKEEEDEEEEGGGWVLGFGDLPGSPSFREYCRFSFPDPDNSSEDGKESLVDAESSVTKGSINSAASATTSPVKASHRSVKERFRRLRILTRGPIAITNMLSLRSCCNHISSTNDESQLLSVKSGY